MLAAASTHLFEVKQRHDVVLAVVEQVRAHEVVHKRFHVGVGIAARAGSFTCDDSCSHPGVDDALHNVGRRRLIHFRATQGRLLYRWAVGWLLLVLPHTIASNYIGGIRLPLLVVRIIVNHKLRTPADLLPSCGGGVTLSRRG